MWLKVLKGTGVAAAGAGLTYLAQVLGDMDFGDATPVVTAALAVLVNVLRKLLTK